MNTQESLDSEQAQSEQHEFNTARKQTWLTAVVVVLGILISGVGVYLWQKSTSKSVMVSLNEQNTSLQQIVSSQQEQIDSKESLGVHFPTGTQLTIDQSPSEQAIGEAVRWELTSGDPSDSCWGPVWQGEATISGWYELRDHPYVGFDEQIWFLRIINRDQWKLPGGVNSEIYGLYGASEELEEKLKNATETNPIALNVKQYSYYCEGWPSITLDQS